MENQDLEGNTNGRRLSFELPARRSSTGLEGIRLRDLFRAQIDTDGPESTPALGPMPPSLVKQSIGPQMLSLHAVPPSPIPVDVLNQTIQTRQPLRNQAPISAEADTRHLSYIEFIHRYNVLYSRARLLKHFESKRDLVDEAVSKEIFQDLKNHSNATRDYHDFRAQESLIFKATSLDTVIEKMVALDEIGGRMELAEEAAMLRKEISTAFLEVLKSTTSGLSSERKHKESRALLARLGMAVGGGLALIVPMLIMVLHPTKLTAILTTSIFTLAMAVALAVFMAHSEPMDIVGFTAAYAAVLVVFIGTGGGTGTG